MRVQQWPSWCWWVFCCLFLFSFFRALFHSLLRCMSWLGLVVSARKLKITVRKIRASWVASPWCQQSWLRSCSCGSRWLWRSQPSYLHSSRQEGRRNEDQALSLTASSQTLPFCLYPGARTWSHGHTELQGWPHAQQKTRVLLKRKKVDKRGKWQFCHKVTQVLLPYWAGSLTLAGFSPQSLALPFKSGPCDI